MSLVQIQLPDPTNKDLIMKANELFEMPIFVDKEANFNDSFRPFYSQDTIDRDFEFIRKGKNPNDDTEYYVAIKKNNSIAVIGIPGTRKDGKPGMEVIGDVDFHKYPNVDGLQQIKFPSNVLQINTVKISDKWKTRGWGYLLYLSLVKAGYPLICDFTQFRGGKALWKKIAKSGSFDNIKVNVIQRGVVMVDEDGKPINYNGDNIHDDEIWSQNFDNKYSLLVMTQE